MTKDVLDDWFRYYNQCSECRRCSVFCPYGIDTAEVTMAAKEIMHSVGLGHKYVNEIIGKVHKIDVYKRQAKDKDYVVDVLGHLEHSYETRKGYWKGGTVGVRGYGGGIIPRFTEIKDENGQPVFKDAAEFHTLRVMPPPGMHYNTATLRKF